MLVRIAYLLTFWWMIATNPAMWKAAFPYIIVASIAGAMGYWFHH